MTEAQAKKHAVLVHHGLGDVVMALPMLSIVDASAAESDQVHVIVKSDVEAQFIRLFPWHHDFEIVSLQWSGSWSWSHPFRVALGLRTKGMATFIAPHAADSAAAGVFSRIIGAARSVGPAGRFGGVGYSVCVSPDKTRRHKTRHYAAFAKAAGFDAPPERRAPVLSQQAQETARSVFSDDGVGVRVVFAPMSSPVETHKRWPFDRFAELGQALLDESPDIRIVIMGAPSEREELGTLAAQLDEKRTVLVTQPSIEQTMAQLQAADCVVSGCTGPLHLATLFDVPIVALFGPTDPTVTGPTGNSFEVITAGLSCAPCYAPGYERGCETPTCMTGISVERVYRSVMAALQLDESPCRE